MSRENPQAVLLSGGPHSAAVAAVIRPEQAYVIDYGQRCAEAEIRAARIVAAYVGIPLRVIRPSCAAVGSGELSGRADNGAASPGQNGWPIRYQVLAALVGSAALEDRIAEICFGLVRSHSLERQNLGEFFVRLSGLMYSQDGSITATAPEITSTTDDLIRKSRLGPDLLCRTYSCLTGNTPCGQCSGCIERAQILGALEVRQGEKARDV